MSQKHNKPQICNIEFTGVVKKCSKCGRDFVVKFGDVTNNICDRCRSFEDDIRKKDNKWTAV